MNKNYDIIIIGAGAAGLFCAAQSAKRGKKVLLLEHANKVGKKILMSGGGRCNFTNLHIDAENYLSQNPHFCKSALSQYTQWDFIALVEQYGIAYHEKTWPVPLSNGSTEELGHGQLFCNNSSKEILAMLLAECDRYQVKIKTLCEIKNVEAGFIVDTSLGQFISEQLVVATGGLSIPKMGATGFAYQLAQQFSIDILPTKAGLVPFVLTDQYKTMTASLSGLSQYTELTNQKASFTAPLLFTHRGLSGPAALQLSSYWDPGEAITINLLANQSEDYLIQAKKHYPNALIRTVLNKVMPKQLVLECQEHFWADSTEVTLQQISHQQLQQIEMRIKNWHIKPSSTEGYRTAEVTLGGINTDELSSKNMEAKKVPGLYFIGEAVDVTGHLGGYNFQWAWSSAFAVV